MAPHVVIGEQAGPEQRGRLVRLALGLDVQSAEHRVYGGHCRFPFCFSVTCSAGVTAGRVRGLYPRYLSSRMLPAAMPQARSSAAVDDTNGDAPAT